MNIKMLLSEFFCDYYDLDKTIEYPIEIVKARDLLVSNRLGLVAKIKYIEARDKNEKLELAKDVYTKHIKALTLGSCCEAGNNIKNSIDQYIRIFDELIDDISANGIDASISVIPLGKDNSIIDGAHRVAIAIYYDLSVPIIRFEKIEVNYDVSFLKSRLLETSVLEILVKDYLVMNSKVSLVITFKQEEVYWDSLLQKNDCIKLVYKKSIRFTKVGVKNLVYVMNQEYDQSDIPSFSLEDMLNSSDDKGLNLKIYIVEEDSGYLDSRECRKESCIIVTKKKYKENIGNLFLSEEILIGLNSMDNSIYKNFIDTLYGMNQVKNNHMLIGIDYYLDLYSGRNGVNFCENRYEEGKILIENRVIHDYESYIEQYGIELNQLLNDNELSYRFLNVNLLSLKSLKSIRGYYKVKKESEKKNLLNRIIKDHIRTKKKMTSLNSKIMDYYRPIYFYTYRFTIKMLVKLKLFAFIKRIKNLVR